MNFLLSHRLPSLIIASIISLCTLYAFQYIQNNFIAEILAIQDTRLRGNIQLIISSIPIITLLWFFRTHDIREAIEKSEENISMSMLTKGMDMIADKDKQRLGLIILAKLKQDNIENQHLVTIIDNITRNTSFGNTDLSFLNLAHINLSKINFMYAFNGAIQNKANLIKTNLREANLEEAKLEHVILTDIDLSNANLHKANLQLSVLTNVNFSGANLDRIDLNQATLSKVLVCKKNKDYLDDKYPEFSGSITLK